MLAAQGVNQYYGGSHTLWDIDLDVKAGDCLCLMGRNGVGKTTLLKVIMGLVPATSGKVRFEQTELLGKPPEAPDPEVLLDGERREDLTPLRHEADAGARGVPEKVLELFPALKGMLKRRGGDLSGGQQQQLAMGRALALDPKLLILDEPTEGIQPNVVAEIGDVIMRLANEGVTVLLVEQKLAFARRVAKSFCILDRGRTVAAGSIAELTDELVHRHLQV